jgi:hypothetical protein
MACEGPLVIGSSCHGGSFSIWSHVLRNVQQVVNGFAQGVEAKVAKLKANQAKSYFILLFHLSPFLSHLYLPLNLFPSHKRSSNR